MKRLYLIFSIPVLILLFTFCKHASLSDLQPPPPPPGCDTLNVTYSSVILAIDTVNCYNGCHNGLAPSSGYHLDSYDSLKYKAQYRHLMERIRQDVGYNPMPQPPNSKLSDCQIAQFQKWIDLNFPQ